MTRAGALVTLASAAASGTPSSLAHLSVNGSSSSSPVAPGSASPNGTCLPSSSTGAWSEHTTSIVPSATPARSAARSRVAAQRRDQPRVRVEPADVDVAQVQVVDRRRRT